MGIVGRFTRDEVSAKVWWPLTMVFLILFVLSFPAQSRAIDGALEDYGAVQGNPGVPTLSNSQVTEDVREEWLGYRIAIGAGFALTFLLALLSMREPRARIGAGVKFYPASVPAAYSVLDAEEAEQLRELGAHARRRVGDLQERIASMESEKQALEGDVQRLLSAAAAKGLVRPVTTDADAPVVNGSAGEGGVLLVPEAGELVVVPDATGGEPEFADVASLPDNSSPVADRPVAEVNAAPPENESPSEMLARMVDAPGGVDVNEAARVELRARLERTSALKKPGSKERRDDRERFDPGRDSERLGGPEGPERLEEPSGLDRPDQR